MKNVKSIQRTRVSNKLLTMQLRIKIDGPEMEVYDPTKAIKHWLLKPSRKNKTGINQKRKVGYMDNKTPVVPVKKSKKIKIFASSDDDSDRAVTIDDDI